MPEDAFRKRTAKQVLLIEDEADIRHFASRVLNLEGYDVLEAADAEEGLRLLRQNPELSLVLLDLRLPGQDGWVILEEIRSTRELSSIPVVVFSASAAERQRNRALEMGAAGYLVKPLDAAGLKKAVAANARWKGVASAWRPAKL